MANAFCARRAVSLPQRDHAQQRQYVVVILRYVVLPGSFSRSVGSGQIAGIEAQVTKARAFFLAVFYLASIPSILPTAPVPRRPPCDATLTHPEMPVQHLPTCAAARRVACTSPGCVRLHRPILGSLHRMSTIHLTVICHRYLA